MALQDAFTQQQLSTPVGEGGERRFAPAARCDVSIDGLHHLLEGVGKALVVAAGIVDPGATLGVAERGIAEQRFVIAVAMTDPELVRRLGIPGHRVFGSLDLERQSILASGCHLVDGHHASSFVV